MSEIPALINLSKTLKEKDVASMTKELKKMKPSKQNTMLDVTESKLSKETKKRTHRGTIKGKKSKDKDDKSTTKKEVSKGISES